MDENDMLNSNWVRKSIFVEIFGIIIAPNNEPNDKAPSTMAKWLELDLMITLNM